MTTSGIEDAERASELRFLDWVAEEDAKNHRLWLLTPEGQQAMDELGKRHEND